MNSLAHDFLESLKAQLDPSATSLSNFITKKTQLRGKPFSFDGHEFQEFITKLIEDNPGYTFVVKKCSQIGLSELCNRIILSVMALKPGTGVLISFPSKAFSQEVIKTRIASVIANSPALSGLLDPNVDSASVKRFLNDSILYGLSGNKGGASSLLNRPIEVVLVDEVDRQDVDVYSGFRSRQTHADKDDILNILISTPTADDIGIDAEFKECGIQYTAMLRCTACQHEFEPDYYEHVHIPGYDENLLLLNKLKASKLPIDDAYLGCPECGEHLDADNSEVFYHKTINEEGVKKKIGIALSPFVAMSFISMPYLVESSFTFTSHVEFLNQGLGKTAKLENSSITVDDIIIQPDINPAGMRVFGLDMGKECAFLSGLLKFDTTIHIDTMEMIKLHELEEFLNNFFLSHPVRVGVMDSQPYSDMVYKLVRKYKQLFSALYQDPVPQPPHLYKLQMQDKHNELVRQVNITKNKVMELAAGDLKNFVTIKPDPNNYLVVDHFTSMRRVRDYRYQEMIYRWVKPKDGQDHFFHAYVYLYTATKLALADFASGSLLPPTVVWKIKDRT